MPDANNAVSETIRQSLSPGRTQFTDADANDPDHDEYLDAPEHPHLATLAKQKVNNLTRRAKRKAKHAARSLRPGHPDDDWHDSNHPINEIEQNPAFDPSRLVAQHQDDVGGTKDKVLGTAFAVGKAIANPKAEVKRKAAAKVAITDRPYLSEQADLEYIEAHADLAEASANSHAPDSQDGQVMRDKKDRVADLKDSRDARKVAWSMSRHVHRVVVVETHPPDPPRTADFYRTDPITGANSFDWQAYGFANARYRLKAFSTQRMGEVDVRPQDRFDKDVCLKYVERILIATSPFQSWFLSVRSLYRWDDPKKTMRWACIWFVLWWQNYIMTFIYCWVVYIVMNNKLRAKQADDLKESYSRARNDNQKAFRFHELIEKHGPDEWLEPLTDQAGPIVQLQLSDIADFLEILANFYEWRDANKTWATLFWFACAITLGISVPTGYSLKIIWMFVLLAVFASRPIASRHPQYRHVVNAIKWIFWEIPTDSQWGLEYLRKRARETREKIVEKEVASRPSLEEANSNLDDAESTATAHEFATADHTSSGTSPSHSPTVLQSFGTRYRSRSCRLLIGVDGLQIMADLPHSRRNDCLRRIPWHAIRELRRTSSGASSGMLNREEIELVAARHINHDREPSNFTSDIHTASVSSPSSKRDSLTNKPLDSRRRNTLYITRLSGFQNRDLAFNSILGFSGLAYQVVQPVVPGNHRSRAGDDDKDSSDSEEVTDAEELSESSGQQDDNTIQRFKDKLHHAGPRMKRLGRKAVGKDKPGKVAADDEWGDQGEGMVKHGQDAAGYDPYQAFRSDSFWEGWFQ